MEGYQKLNIGSLGFYVERLVNIFVIQFCVEIITSFQQL